MKALEDITIADFSWVISGPVGSTYLAQHGARVVKIESMSQPDSLRTNSPYKDRKPGIDRSGYFAYLNPGKLSIAIDLKTPAGREVARRLISKVDIVMENYTAGTMKQWGLDYDSLKKVNPDLIMLSLSMHGQTGPHSKHLGYGIELQGFVGYTNLTGWPDREIAQPHGALTDFLAPLFAVATLLAAIEYRRRTGKGQYLDLSQGEAAMYTLSPEMLNYTANGVPGSRHGNSCAGMAPHGAYRCPGDDRWCAIAIESDQEWKAFSRLAGGTDWTLDSKFSTLAARKDNEDELNKLVESWTIGKQAADAASLLQAAGIAAGVVKNTGEVFQDRQLRHRGYFQEIEQSEMGRFASIGHCAAFSRTPAELRPAPRLGEHTEYVCREIIGMNDEEFCKLMDDGVLR